MWVFDILGLSIVTSEILDIPHTHTSELRKQIVQIAVFWLIIREENYIMKIFSFPKKNDSCQFFFSILHDCLTNELDKCFIKIDLFVKYRDQVVNALSSVCSMLVMSDVTQANIISKKITKYQGQFL